MVRPVFLLAVFAILASGQATHFEAASIKPNNSGSSGSSDNTLHGRLTVINETVKQLMQFAFGVKDFQITGGPGWLETARYDIAATTGNADPLNDEQWGVLIQSLLADRFALKVHRETKESTVYSLVVAKGGPKMTVDMEEGGSQSNTNSKDSRVTMVVKRTTAAQLASRLERQVGRRVTDNTGLTEHYDFTLVWSQDQSVDPTGPTIFTALQEQLGLRLESMKGPVDMVVIDAVDRPSEN